MPTIYLTTDAFFHILFQAAQQPWHSDRKIDEPVIDSPYFDCYLSGAE